MSARGDAMTLSLGKPVRDALRIREEREARASRRQVAHELELAIREQKRARRALERRAAEHSLDGRTLRRPKAARLAAVDAALRAGGDLSQFGEATLRFASACRSLAFNRVRRGFATGVAAAKGPPAQVLPRQRGATAQQREPSAPSPGDDRRTGATYRHPQSAAANRFGAPPHPPLHRELLQGGGAGRAGAMQRPPVVLWQHEPPTPSSARRTIHAARLVASPTNQARSYFVQGRKGASGQPW